ncbi:MAG TPA: VOC family protein [Rhodopila sp.]|uniref:VOC family protein n=1 Tax=Rhodopila sp. TaxID=2480087 RepID=UPI002D15A6EF|nr:VOC family protein [Rhodopila sp.]HVY18043.1 VOC family protein [Rhodopila sp.]
MPVSPIPAGYHALTPYIIVEGAARALQWYADVFAAKEELRLEAPNGRVGHAEIKLGDSKVMLADANPDSGAEAPAKFGGSPVSLHLYVPDVDAVVAKAAATGATVKSQPENKFYGDRLGTIVDPFGHTWHVSTHVEDVTAAEIERRMKAMVGKG